MQHRLDTLKTKYDKKDDHHFTATLTRPTDKTHDQSHRKQSFVNSENKYNTNSPSKCPVNSLVNNFFRDALTSKSKSKRIAGNHSRDRAQSFSIKMQSQSYNEPLILG